MSRWWNLAAESNRDQGTIGPAGTALLTQMTLTLNQPRSVIESFLINSFSDLGTQILPFAKDKNPDINRR